MTDLFKTPKRQSLFSLLKKVKTYTKKDKYQGIQRQAGSSKLPESFFLFDEEMFNSSDISITINASKKGENLKP